MLILNEKSLLVIWMILLPYGVNNQIQKLLVATKSGKML